MTCATSQSFLAINDELTNKGFPVATSSGFAIGVDGVLVIDTMVNKRLNQQFLSLIAEQINLPIRYAVNTSYHGDHSYGNFYLAEDVVIIQYEATNTYIAEQFPHDVSFKIQNFGKGRGIEEIKPVDAHLLVSKGSSLSVNLGDFRVDVRDYGFAQTAGDLYVSVPSANVLWTGNPVLAKAPALP